MNKFKVGDKLRVLPGNDTDDFKSGDIVTVTQLCGEGFVRVNARHYQRAESRFELAAEQPAAAPAKVRKLTGYCKAVFDVLSEAQGQPVAAAALDYACLAACPRQTKSTDATGARIRDLRKPIYGGHNIVYSAKDKTYTLLPA